MALYDFIFTFILVFFKFKETVLRLSVNYFNIPKKLIPES